MNVNLLVVDVCTGLLVVWGGGGGGGLVCGGLLDVCGGGGGGLLVVVGGGGGGRLVVVGGGGGGRRVVVAVAVCDGKSSMEGQVLEPDESPFCFSGQVENQSEIAKLTLK